MTIMKKHEIEFYKKGIIETINDWGFKISQKDIALAGHSKMGMVIQHHEAENFEDAGYVFYSYGLMEYREVQKEMDRINALELNEHEREEEINNLFGCLNAYYNSYVYHGVKVTILNTIYNSKKEDVERMDLYTDFFRIEGMFITNLQVSRSGMSRTFDFYTVDTDGRGDLFYTNINDTVSKLTGMKRNKEGKLLAQGCGIDFRSNLIPLFGQDAFNINVL